MLSRVPSTCPPNSQDCTSSGQRRETTHLSVEVTLERLVRVVDQQLLQVVLVPEVLEPWNHKTSAQAVGPNRRSARSGRYRRTVARRRSGAARNPRAAIPTA